jgi:HSP20 family protein
MNALTPRRSATLLDELWRDFSPGFYVQPLHGDPLPQQIRLDVKEHDGAFEVQAEIPGVRKEDIHVDIDGNILRLEAEVKQEDRQEDQGRVMRSERYYGSVSRSVQLPAEIDEAGAKARYENGVLALTLPKKAAGPRQRVRID